LIVRITNTPRPYAWGSTSAIAELLGTAPSGGPEAELWLGSHPGSPARILDGAAEPDLRAWAEAHTSEGRLPFLLKVLAAASPLSLQAHPSLAQAQAGFARENAAQLAPDAPERNYVDPHPKPELMLALSDPFRALCGFRPVTESHADLAALGDERLEPLLTRLADGTALRHVVEWLLTRGDGVDEVVSALSAHGAAVEGDERGTWLGTVRMLAEKYPGDPGIAISTLLHTILLRPGEALFLPAGNIHAYLHGLGIELMASSDNVLRGGLTTKRVDVEELLRVLDARPMPAPYLRPEHPVPGVAVYQPDGVDFALLDVDDQALTAGAALAVGPLSIVLCLRGSVRVGSEATLHRGEAALVDGRVLHLAGAGRTVVATSG
jgi:mannose-6-phosphate isomerase